MYKKRICKNIRGSHKLLQVHKIVCNENERNKEENNININDGEALYKEHTKTGEIISINFGSKILDTMKVLFI